METKRLSRLGNIRALAIMLVVLGHSIILYSPGWGLYETTVSVPLLAELKRIVDIPQMLLFFALSGYLFAFTHRKKRGLPHLLKQKALRLLVPYLCIGLGYMIPIRILAKLPSYQNMGIGTLAQKFLTAGDVGHLWFLPALFCTFILSELILSLAERIPGLKRIPEFVFCALALGLYLEGYRIGFGYGPLLNTFYYLPWFALGYLLNIRQNLLTKLYGIGPLKWLLILGNLALMAYSLWGGSLRVLLSLTMQGLCVVNAFGAMPERSCGILEKIDRNSFGIYLFHSPLIYLTCSAIPNAHPAVVVALNFVVFGAVAFGLTELVRKTKWKFLIGE